MEVWGRNGLSKLQFHPQIPPWPIVQIIGISIWAVILEFSEDFIFFNSVFNFLSKLYMRVT